MYNSEDIQAFPTRSFHSHCLGHAHIKAALMLSHVTLCSLLLSTVLHCVMVCYSQGYSCLHLAALTSKADLLKWLVTTYALEVS